jgi:hypothetical protein
MTTVPPPVDPQARDDLHRIAVHVLGRRRHAVTGRFGLRPAAGGFGTPPFGDDAEVLRLSGGVLVRERAGATAALALDGADLAALAAFAEVDLDQAFSVGHDTPPVGDPAGPLAAAAAACAALGDWYAIGAVAIDAVVAALGAEGDASLAQLWPEHFDLGLDVAWGPGEGQRINLGASPGDAFVPEPYLYTGPHGPERPGDAAYWNAPFGATLTRTALATAPDPAAAAATFLRRGVDLLRAA